MTAMMPFAYAPLLKCVILNRYIGNQKTVNFWFGKALMSVTCIKQKVLDRDITGDCATLFAIFIRDICIV